MSNIIRRIRWFAAPRRHQLLLLSGAMLALAGCKTAPTTAPAAPPLQLIQSEPLVLAADCHATGSYFVEFSVLSDGRTGDIQAPQGPACLQQALTAWVSSFRYAAPGQDIPFGVEWMMVTAPRTTSQGT